MTYFEIWVTGVLLSSVGWLIFFEGPEKMLGSAVAAILWPITVPVVLGAFIVCSVLDWFEERTGHGK